MLDSKQQEDLRARFNPDGSDLRRLQSRMLEMLKYIDKVCRENGIKYWLSSGTCLGAVRHGGFIPWDDDVDIEMCLEDFIKLRDYIKAHPSDDYCWQDTDTDRGYYYPFAKLRDKYSVVKEEQCSRNYGFNGVFIDIFILTPSNSLRLRRSSTYWYCVLLPRCSFSGLLRRTVKDFIIPLLEKAQHIRPAGVYRHISGTYFFKERYLDDFREITYMPFEDTQLPVPAGYDHYLSVIYGDYKNLPDLDTIHPHFSKVEFTR